MITKKTLFLSIALGTSIAAAFFSALNSRRDNDGTSPQKNLLQVEKTRNRPKRQDYPDHNRETPSSVSNESQYSGDSRLEDPAALLDSLEANSNGVDKGDLYLEIIAAYDTNNWEKMLDFVAILPPGSARDRALNRVFERLSRDHPNVWTNSIDEITNRFSKSDLLVAALKFGKEMGKSDNASQIFSMVLGSASVDPNAKRVFLASMVEEWSKKDSTRAATEVLRISDAELKSAIIERNMQALAEPLSYNDSVLDNFTNVANPAERSNLMQILGTMRADANVPLKDSELQDLPEACQRQLLLSYYSTKANQDLNAALNEAAKMGAGKMRDSVIESLLPRIRVIDSARELEWIESISDEQLRKNLYSKFVLRNGGK